MPRKKRNWEIENLGVHNTPEQFYFTFGKVSLFSNNLFKTPSVTVNRVLQGDTVDKVHKWEIDNKIKKTKMLEWVDLIHPLTGLFGLSKENRKQLFSDYKETQITKLKKAIQAIEKAEKNLYNDEVRLVHLVEPLSNQKLVYQVVLKAIQKRQTGEHQLLYDQLMPLVEKLTRSGESEYRVKQVIDNLMLIFNYDGESVGQSIFKYQKKPYFPKRIMDMINKAGKQPFQPLHEALKKHLNSI
tara:strand:- start:1667 stop:2392 length:726 start_codon:yes stop_codon:yes gene_type:complete